MVANLDTNSFKIPVKIVTANKTLDLTDSQSRQFCTNTVPVTIAIPLTATVPFPLGTFIYIEKSGTGSLSIASTAGVSIANHQGTLTSPQSVLNQGLLIKVGNESWLYLRLPNFTEFSEPLAAASTAAAHRLLVRQENIFANFNDALADRTTVTAIGVNAGAASTAGTNWTSIGCNSGAANTTGINWTSIGFNAGILNTTGNGWTGMGVRAGGANTTGSNWTGMGVRAGGASTTGGNWTAVGVNAGGANTTGINWTAVGVNAAITSTTGSNWTAIGTSTAGGITTGSGNTVIGAHINNLPATLENNVILGSGDGIIKLQCDSTGICTLQSGLKITTTSATLTRQLTETKAIVTPSTTDTITVTGAALGDLVAVSRGSNAFVSAVNTVTFDSTGLAGVTVRAVVTRYTA